MSKDLCTLLDALVKRSIDTFTDEEYACLVNFIDTMLDKAKRSGRVAKVTING